MVRTRFRSSLAAPLALALACPAVCVSGCGPGRTVAATQPSDPKSFDAAASDPKAVAIADEVWKAVGGDAFLKAKELRWKVAVLHDGQPKFEVAHAWDRWNGRHQLRREPKDGGPAGVLAMYELYSDRGTANVIEHGGKVRQATREDQRSIIQDARRQWETYSYMLFMPFKLKDPGVTLKWVEERPEVGGDATVMKYDVLRVSFAPGVGSSPGDVYYVLVDKTSHLIDTVEIVETGRKDNERIAYKWSDWVEVGGMKVATRRKNLGFASEEIVFSDVQARPEPEEEMYVPVVR